MGAVGLSFPTQTACHKSARGASATTLNVNSHCSRSVLEDN